MSKNEPIDEAFTFLLEKLEKEGFKKLSKRVMVKDTKNWLVFVQLSSILNTRPWTRGIFRYGFWCEVGALLKGAKHPTVTQNMHLYREYPANSAVDCHFRRILKPPFFLRHLRAPQYFHTGMWRCFRSNNLNALNSIFDIEVEPWLEHLANLSDVERYVDEVINSNEIKRNNENRIKWGDVYGIKELKEFFQSTTKN